LKGLKVEGLTLNDLQRLCKLHGLVRSDDEEKMRANLVSVRSFFLLKEEEKNKIAGPSALSLVFHYEEEQQRPVKPAVTPVGMWKAVGSDEQKANDTPKKITKEGKTQQETAERREMKEEGNVNEEDVDGEPLDGEPLYGGGLVGAYDDDDIDGEPL
jgi:hypothetical protein